MDRPRRIAVVLVGVAAAVPLALASARAGGPSAASPGRGGSVEVARAAVIEQGAGAAGRADRPLESAACPPGMALVEGDWCPRVEQRCLRWMDPPGRYHQYRCAEYARPARCLAPREHRRFCIDRHERTDPGSPGSRLPINHQSWTDARRACEAQGARVCLDSEWTFACEGEEMRPYPYGWQREASRCNADHTDLLVPGDHSRLVDERAPVDAHPECASPFGLVDMAGNVAEWVSVDGYPAGSYVVQKGNWWQPGKQACRDEQAGHDRFYKGTETGFRCCADARQISEHEP